MRPIHKYSSHPLRQLEQHFECRRLVCELEQHFWQCQQECVFSLWALLKFALKLKLTGLFVHHFYSVLHPLFTSCGGKYNAGKHRSSILCESLFTLFNITMKKYNSLKPLWCNYNSLLSAFYEVKKHKSNYPCFIKYEHNLSRNLSRILSSLENDTYRVKPYRSFFVYDPKLRLIEAPHIDDRIVQHSLLHVIRPLVENKFIYDTYACIKNRGTHAASDKLYRFLNSYRTSSGYCLKVDVRKFFYNIRHSRVKAQVSHIIKCKDTLSLIFRFLGCNCVGLPLGNVTSQLLANLALNPIDQYVKRKLKVSHYLRYMDDMILLHPDKSFLTIAKNHITGILRALGLETNDKTKISKISEGIDFVGYRHFINYRLVRPRIFRRNLRILSTSFDISRYHSFIAHSKRTASLPYIINSLYPFYNFNLSLIEASASNPV